MRTDLASDDGRMDDEKDKFVEKLVQEAYTGIQERALQRCHGGFKFSLHVGLGDDHVLQSEWERVLL